MPSNNDIEKVNKLFDEYLNEISSDQNAEEYLKSEGFNPNELVNEGIRKIKQMQMKMASAKTESAYSALTAGLLDKAKEEVRRLMEMANFDFAAYVKKEEVVGAFRNLESLSEDEKREFLEKHILLKLEQRNNDEKTN